MAMLRLFPPQVGESTRIQPQMCWMSIMHEYPLSSGHTYLGISKSWRVNESKSGIGERYNLVFNPQRGILKRSTTSTIFASLPSIAPPPVDLASNLFTFGTAFVVPFYTVMILAPQAKWTKKIVESSLPYVILGILYAYLLSLSWSPETLQLMFASKYWLPELPGITKMFSSTMTVASAWIHLLAVDLFAGRQIYLDGLQHSLETRHSLVLCLLFCPIGILSHYITKALVQVRRRIGTNETAEVARVYS